MFMDCFQLGKEKAWFTNFFKLSVDSPNTTHKLVTNWNFFEQHVFAFSFLAAVFGHN